MNARRAAAGYAAIFVGVAAAAVGLYDTGGARAASDTYPAVTDARLLGAAHDPGWLMYLRSYRSDGHAPFAEISTKNVAGLTEAFTHRVAIPEGFEAPPIVNGRTMIVTTPLDRVYALDATNGALLWEYHYPVPKRAFRTACCDMVNRGVALYGTNAYFATLDSHVVALDARTGKVVWNTQVYDQPGVGYSMSGAPLVVKGVVIVGAGGGEYGARGFLVGLDARTGKQRWRTYTVPAPNEYGGNTWPGKTYLHGGANPWVTGSYDAETDTLLWGTGNPGPWLATERKGRNLFSDCVIAVNPSNGHIKWYFQQTPNDSWDYDATNTPGLADVVIDGRPRKVFYQAGRTGWFYVVDRTNGKFIHMSRFTVTNAITGYDTKNSIGITDPKRRPTVGKSVFVCPAFFGGDNWYPSSFDPQTGYAYVPTMRTCMNISGLVPAPFKAGNWYLDETFDVTPAPGTDGWGAFQAIDVATGKTMWHFNTKMPWNDGALSTDGGLVFSGTPDRKFYAFDARSGKVLWQHQMSSGVIGVPISYEVDGRQYVAVQSGWGGVSPFWGGAKMTPLFRGIPLGGNLYVFTLPRRTAGATP